MLYKAVRGLLKPFWHLLFRLRVSGREHVSASGPLILCCNHFAWADPITLAVSVRRQVHFMAKQEIFSAPILGPLVPLLGAFPVKRGTADRASLKQALAVLQRGEVFGIFPEGTRSRTRELMRPEVGVVWIAVRSRTPVVPMAITGDYRLGGPLVMRIGPPVDLSDLYEQKLTTETMEVGATRIQESIAQLLAG